MKVLMIGAAITPVASRIAGTAVKSAGITTCRPANKIEGPPGCLIARQKRRMKMTKQEAVKILENIRKYDSGVQSFVSLYHAGQIHKMVKAGKNIAEIIKLAETQVTLPGEIKEALVTIFTRRQEK